MAADVAPASVAQVAIVRTDVFGAVAHHARCMVGACTWTSARRDSRDGTTVDPRVVKAAEDHGAAHTAAQDALDGA